MIKVRRVAAGMAIGAMALNAGCGGSSNPNPTLPSAPTKTEVFSGHLEQGKVDYGPGNANHFTITNPGIVTVTLTKISPAPITLGLGLGFYDATSSECLLYTYYDTATLNLAVSDQIGGATELCIGVYDVNTITDPVDYEMTVTHT